MVVLSLIGKVADVELERSPAIGSDPIYLEIDSLLSALVDEKVVPEAESDYVTKAIVGIDDSIRILGGMWRG